MTAGGAAGTDAASGAGARVERAGPPPDWLIAVVNPVLRVLLRSPLHWLVSHTLALITVTGRKTGTEYTFPVGYEQDGDTVVVASHGTNWWKNLRDGGQDVSLVLRGARRSGHAEVTEDDEVVASYVHDYLQRAGPRGSRRVGLSIEGDEVPPPSVLEDHVGHVVLVTVTLDS